MTFRQFSAVPEQPTLSPDGGRCVYVLRTTDIEGDRNVSRLWMVDTSGGEPRQLTRGQADTAPAWSPDGSRIAFLRGGDGPAQLWLLPAGGGEAEQLTTVDALPLGAGKPVWSPDGSRIAFGAPADLEAMPGEDGEARERRGKGPITADRLDYQLDGAGMLRKIRHHVHVLDLETREVKQVTGGDWHAAEPAWSPDGTTLAYTAATAPDADLTWRTPVYVVDVTASAPVPRVAAV